MSRGWRPLAVLVLLFLVYAALFIYRTSFVLGGHRYFSLFDDAMVSMRFARHFAAGLGLEWNPGERVEGFTNPLWVFFMAAIHLLPISISKTGLVVQIAAALLLAANIIVVYQIAHALGGSQVVALGAALLTASYLPLNNWSLQGMEVSLLVLAISGSVWLCLLMLDGDDQCAARCSVLYVLLGVSTWVRPDMAVTLVGIGAFMVVVDRPRRTRHLAWASGALAAGIASQTLFRLWYFGLPFPNTYYLKMTGYPAPLRIARGLYVLVQFLWTANPLLFVIAAVAFRARDRRAWLLAWVFAVQMVYSAYVGGDAWEYWGGANRYIVIAIPAFFVLLSDALAAIAPRRFGFTVLVFISVMCMNSISGPGALEELILLRPPLHAGPGGENAQDVERALILVGVSSPAATVAVVRAGTLPYFSDRPGVDLLGKMDRTIAMEPSRVPGGARRFMDFRPGHTKWDDAYSLGRLMPDVVMQVWGDKNEAAPYLRDYRRYRLGPDCVYVREGSARVDEARLEPCR